MAIYVVIVARVGRGRGDGRGTVPAESASERAVEKEVVEQEEQARA
ncbi:hypothetical protein [Pseudonocardia xishanensis]|uniref:Uncharacterized protein n=1 Tax=Pseudonocardia xishanensis TaxID=630995 RepID=A0ABP8S4W6_9PSEU